MEMYTRECPSCKKNMVEVNILYKGLTQEQVNCTDKIDLTKDQVEDNNIKLSDEELELLNEIDAHTVVVDNYNECENCGSDYVRDENGKILDE